MQERIQEELEQEARERKADGKSSFPCLSREVGWWAVLDYGDDLLRGNLNHSHDEGDSEEELDDVETLIAGVERTTLYDKLGNSTQA